MNRISTARALGFGLLCTVLTSCDSPPSPADATQAFAAAPATPGVERCQALVGTRLGSATIEGAEPIARGEHLVGVFRRLFFRVLARSPLPDLSVPTDFCRVTAKLRPMAGSEITAEVWLPEQWNGKFVATGGGGFSGGLGAAFLTLWRPLQQGYAGMANDVGHEATDSAKFAHESRQQFVDYAYQGNHVAAEFAKALIASYYGRPASRAYFHGCSNGGRDALMAARRFPDDYDGIIAGAPAAGWTKLMTSFAWNAQAARRAPELEDKLQLVQDAVIARCDALDGVKDQLLENPASCRFDPADLQCKSHGADCLGADEVAALRKIYGGPRLPDGTQVYAGMPVGGEALRGNWKDWIANDESTQAKFATEAFRWMVYGDPKWEVDRFDIARDYPKARESMGSLMDSDDPDLSAFTDRGGKLLLYHGWNDAAIPAGATIDYHAALRKNLGPVADAQVRLFMIPGMMHCGAGIGPNDYDLLRPLDSWVESGVVPARIVASEYDPRALFGPAPGAKVVRTRPLCPWPKVAHYDGSGSTDDAANFSCR
jgi:pimeloyl-ACP methyl ester carboxylesterase